MKRTRSGRNGWFFKLSLLESLSLLLFNIAQTFIQLAVSSSEYLCHSDGQQRMHCANCIAIVVVVVSLCRRFDAFKSFKFSSYKLKYLNTLGSENVFHPLWLISIGTILNWIKIKSKSSSDTLFSYDVYATCLNKGPMRVFLNQHVCTRVCG